LKLRGRRIRLHKSPRRRKIRFFNGERKEEGVRKGGKKQLPRTNANGEEQTKGSKNRDRVLQDIQTTERAVEESPKTKGGEGLPAGTETKSLVAKVNVREGKKKKKDLQHIDLKPSQIGEP